MFIKELAILFLSIIAVTAHASTVNVSFEIGTVDYSDYYNITTEYSGDGLNFSHNSNGLDIGFTGTELGENLVINKIFTNMFRVDFINAAPVIKATVTFSDSNLNPQTHALYAFDDSGAQVDFVSYFDNGYHPDPFDLTVSFAHGISSIVAQDLPAGSQKLLNISYEISEVPLPSALWLFISSLAGVACLKKHRRGESMGSANINASA